MGSRTGRPPPPPSRFLALAAAKGVSPDGLTIAFDPGWRTGWALTNGRCGTIDIRRWKGGDEAEGLIAFQAAVKVLLADVRRVVIERPVGKTVATLWPETLARLIHMTAREARVERHEVTADQWRRALTGRAREVPDKLVKERVSSLGFRPASEHEADAAGVLIGWIALRAEGLVS